MSCYVMLEFTAKPGTDPAALEGPSCLIGGKPDKGWLRIELTVNEDDSNNMLLVMRWVSRRHYQTYRDWREANGDVKRFADATVSGLSTRFFDIIDA